MSTASVNFIRNCVLKFRRVCPQTWDRLQPTEVGSVRFCDTCHHEVFFCSTDPEAIEHARQGHCIAKLMPAGPGRRNLVLGRPATPPPPRTPEELALAEEYRSEAEKTRALRDIKWATRFCPQCGYPFDDNLDTCRVCGCHMVPAPST